MSEVLHYFTSWGVVYAGVLYEPFLDSYPNHYIIIQKSKLNDFLKLAHDEITPEKINEYGWLLNKDSVLDIVKEVPRPPINALGPEKDNNIERKLCFIFGAGASAHCVSSSECDAFYNDPFRPPVGADLFNTRFKELMRSFKGVINSIQGLANRNDVEGLFEEEWQDISYSNNREFLRRHINIQYYIQLLLKKSSERVTNEYFMNNLYSILAYKLQKIHAQSVNPFGHKKFTQFSFITFNQDTILEYFLSEQFGIEFNTLDDYVNFNHSPVCIYKPHGSWNWGWRFPQKPNEMVGTSEYLYTQNFTLYDIYCKLLGSSEKTFDWTSYGREWSLDKNYKGKIVVNKSNLELIKDDLDNYFPALLIPYRDKDEFTMPYKHLDYMNYIIQEVETLIIIGWKGNEAMFNYNFKNKNRSSSRLKKVIIADPDAESVKRNLVNSICPNVEFVFYKSFEDFIFNGFDREIE